MASSARNTEHAFGIGGRAAAFVPSSCALCELNAAVHSPQHGLCTGHSPAQRSGLSGLARDQPSKDKAQAAAAPITVHAFPLSPKNEQYGYLLYQEPSARATRCAVCMPSVCRAPQHAQQCEMHVAGGPPALVRAHHVPRRAGWQGRGGRGHVIGLVTGGAGSRGNPSIEYRGSNPPCVHPKCRYSRTLTPVRVTGRLLPPPA